MAVLFWLSLFGIAYIYVGYPLLLFLLSRLRSRTKSSWRPSSTPSVTLLIAAYNEERTIADRLRNALELDYPVDQLQILVAADGSGDATADRVREFANRKVELSFSPRRVGKTAAVARAMAAARGEIVVFSDANNAYNVEALRWLVAPFVDRSVGGVAGAKRIARGDGALGDSEDLYWRYESSIRSWESQLGSCIGAPGEIFAIRRELFEPPPQGIINDDFYLAMRLLVRGHRVVYQPLARSVERVSLASADEIVRRRRINAGRFQALLYARQLLPLHPLLLWQALSHKLARPLVPLLMLTGLVANILLVLDTPSIAARTGPFGRLVGIEGGWAEAFLLAQAAIYLAALAGSHLEGSARLGRLLYLPRFLVQSNWAALLGLVAFLRGSQGAMWARAARPGEL